MLWFVWIAAGLVALFLTFFTIAWLVGRSLPKDHVHRATLTLDRVTPEQAWDLCADMPGWPKWAGVDAITPLEHGGPDAYRMTMGRNAMRARWTRRERPAALEVSVEDEKGFFTGTWSYAFRPAGAGCVIELTERGTVHHPVPRFFIRYLSDPALYLKRHLRFVAQHFGEKPQLA